MCVNKVYVRDYLRASRVGNYFACGRCPACLQSRADRRSRRIRYHTPQGFTSYFVTLTYSNKFVPYARKSDMLKQNETFFRFDLKKKTCDLLRVPIYRDYDFRYYGKKKFIKRNSDPVVGYSKYVKDPYNVSDMSGITYTHNNKVVSRDSDKISVSFTPDSQNFFKRLRKNLSLAFGKTIPISYYSAPEYGPTNQRFHLHFLIWFPSCFSEWQVRSFCSKAWPYSDRNKSSKFCEVARNPASYLASYVNCSSNVSLCLQKSFPLRPSHSLDFGISSDVFSFQNVFKTWREKKEFGFELSYIGSDGRSVQTYVSYPQYITSRYFPKFKGFSRLNRDKIVNALSSPSKFFALSSTPSRYTENSEDVYPLLMYDSWNPCFEFTGKLANYTILRINRAYDLYFRPLGYTRFDFANFVVDFWDDYNNFLYYKSQQNVNPYLNLQAFYNLSMVESSAIANESITSLLNSVDSFPENFFDPNSFVQEISENIRLTNKYNKNIKQRKLNCL